MKNVIKVLMLLFFVEVQSYDQLVVIPPSCSSNNEITLKGTNAAPGAMWTTAQDGDARITNHRSLETNVSLERPNDYHFELVVGFQEQRTVLERHIVRAVHHAELPLNIMTQTLVPRLLTHQYQYLALGHHFFSSNLYYPKVGRFFRAYVDKTSAMLDKVIEYIMKKHVTTSALDGSNPPNYSCFLMDKPNSGLQSSVTLDSQEAPMKRLKQGFNVAFKCEKRIVNILTSLTHSAERFADSELVEFLANELIPEVTKSMKVLANHKKTLARLCKKNEALGEYIFEREFE